MVFNSIEFFLFLPAIFFLYWFVVNKNLFLQNLLILIASYCFYGWGSWIFILLLAISTLLDYTYAFYVDSPNKKKAKVFLWISIFSNLGILGIFKYYNFFTTQFQLVFKQLGIHSNPIFLDIALPVGISFYTFHGMSYIFDIYHEKQRPVKSFVDYAVFVSFFPLLVAGPIERANHLLPQVQQKRLFNYNQAVEGCRLILWGLFKKIVIADSLAGIVDEIFNNYMNHNSLTLIFGAIGFSFQIYCDFSGYSDIALGTAKLFNFELLSNFKFPYFSRDIAEFWRRWHISLSTWFKDYLYIPIGGSKKGKWISIRNVFIIFIISGFWHGASWNYILWGGIHACGFLPLLLFNKNRKHIGDVVAQNSILPNLKELWQMITTFIFITFAWIFFRLQEFGDSIGYINAIYFNKIIKNEFIILKNIIILIIPIILIDWYFRKDERKLKLQFNFFIRVGIYIIFILSILLKYSDNSNFIYYKF
jgi:D-alanyl-lipoteichoic acid acyltransferase DltB (MBOAT superfamily)